jgi:hypothetical protein
MIIIRFLLAVFKALPNFILPCPVRELSVLDRKIFSRPDAFLEIRSSPVGDFGFPLTFGQTDQNKPQSVLIWAKIVDEQPLNSVGVDAVSWWETFELPILPCGQLPRLTWPDGPQVDIAKRLILADWFSIFKISDFWKKT